MGVSIVIVIYLDFHSAKRALWLVDSWSRAPDQTQMYPDEMYQEQHAVSGLYCEANFSNCIFIPEREDKFE